MSEPEAIIVRELQEQYFADVIRIHKSGLGYTLNSRFGGEHLQFLYRSMAQDSGSYVGVAVTGDRPVGVISGTVSADALKTRLFKNASVARKGRLALRILSEPSLALEWRKGSKIGATIEYQGREVAAVLTAIAVDPEFRGRGIGKLLIAALERCFSERGIESYRLDTLIANVPAREFYLKLGFKELARREDSIIFVKTVQT
jgi:ribosomal protein S18 acetylase RimI-like enzyme